MWEIAVIRRPSDDRHRREPALHLFSLQRYEAGSDQRGECRPHFRGVRPAGAFDLDLPEGEHPRLASAEIRAERAQQHHCQIREAPSEARALQSGKEGPQLSSPERQPGAATIRRPELTGHALHFAAVRKPPTWTLRPDGLRQLECTQKLDLVLERDTELLVRAPTRLGHQGNRVR